MSEVSGSVAAILDTLKNLPDYSIYLFLFLSSVLENIFPPWPSDVIIIFSGFLAGYGVITFSGAFISSLSGNVAGGVIMYYFGWQILWKLNKFQRTIHAAETKGLRHYLFQFLSADNLDKAKNKFEKNGALFVLISRFFPGIRFFVSIVAGVSSMKLRIFMISFAMGSFVWGIILIYAGYILGNNWEEALRWFKLYNYIAVLIMVLAFSVWLYYKLSKTKKLE